MATNVEEFDDVEIYEDFSRVFPYHRRDKIPFQDPQFTKLQLPPNVISQFKDLCNKQLWNSVEQLLNNYQQHIATSPCLKDSKLQQWLSELQTRTYPTSINQADIKVEKRLDGGEFNDVYLAEWRLRSGGKLLAVYKKRLQDDEKWITAEFNTWAAISPHNNIARLYGAVWKGEGNGKRMIGLVAELHTNGSLLGKLEQSRMGASDSTMLKVLLGVAQGLQHLHKNDITHRDIFACNILLNRRLVPIITGFGLAGNETRMIRMFPRGSAPETRTGGISIFESDIYCLGVLVWQMANPGRFVPNALTFKGPTEASKIALRCSHPDPKSRPSLDQVIMMCTSALAHLDREVIEDKEVNLSELFKQLNILNGEELAEKFKEKNFTPSVLRMMEGSLFFQECTRLGMTRADIFATALGVRLEYNAVVKLLAMSPDEEDEHFDDMDEYADFSKLFPFHCQDDIPFNNSKIVKNFSSSTAGKNLRRLCDTQKWKTINELLTNIEKTQAPYLEDRELKSWLDELRARTYPAHVDSNDITRGDPLAKGNFGEVYSAHWKLKSGGKVIVAYKKLLKDESAELMKEFNMWTALPPHDNVARLYGAVWDDKRIVALLAELHTKGSLVGNSKLEVGEHAKLQVVLGVAKGLQHLHKHMIVHRDVFARNILLKKDDHTDELIPILTDFGLSRVAPYKWSHNRLIPRGTAPEVEQDRRPFTFTSDIYSIGVLIWEMSHPGKELPDKFEFFGQTMSNTIAVRCCKRDPDARPTLETVIDLCNKGLAACASPAIDEEKGIVVDGELLAMLKELEISEPEERARGFAKDKCTLKRIRALPYPLLEKECLGQGMAKGEVFDFAGKLGKL